MIKHLEHQIEWSKATFGPGERRLGVREHILKEIEEIREAPNDLEEWADLFILACDGAWRHGAHPEEVARRVMGGPPVFPSVDTALAFAQVWTLAIGADGSALVVSLFFIAVAVAALDGAGLAGFSFEQLFDAVVAKQAKNERRVWPDWRTMTEDQAIEHVR